MSDAAVPGGTAASIEWLTDRRGYLEAAGGAGRRVPIVAAVAVDDPWLAFRRARDGEWNVCFETRGASAGWNAFGVTPRATLTVRPEDIDPDATSLRALDDLVTDTGGVEPGEGPLPGGWFGWLSYDIARELETLPTSTERDRDLPRIQFARFDPLATWSGPVEGGRVRLRVVSMPRPAGDPSAAYDRGRGRIERLVERVRSGDPATPWGDAGARLAFTPGCDRRSYRRRVERVQRYIRDGDTFQVNLSQRFDAPATIHPVDAYDALRRANPAPYSGLLETPDVDLVSTSPELLVERHGDRVRTEPIAGTRPRGESPAADQALADELRADPKERAEHAMLVDLERNDLGRICRAGSVEVTEYRRVDRYASVWHLVSVVEGRLREDVATSDVFGAMLPGGTVTGAPKPRTMEIIDELEERRRGPYTGSMAAIGFDGTVVANMVIRTLEHHDGAYRLRVGGGIVHDSDPDAEFDETLAKAAAIRDALSVEGGGP